MLNIPHKKINNSTIQQLSNKTINPVFFLLSKLLDFALSPVLWLLWLLALAWRAKTPQRQRRWLGAGLGLALLLTNPALVNEALLAWEMAPVPLAALPRRADAAVLLTGIANGQKSPHDRVYLAQGADRLTNALWLWRAGRVRRILVSGGSGAVLGAPQTEAADLVALLRLAGVPAAAIWQETRSRNTRENALFSRAFLCRHPEADTLVLVTSAFHQRRALGCFRRVGLHPWAFPADVRTTDRQPTPDYWLLPSAEALARWGLLLHEVAGWAVYRLRGWC